MKKEKAEQKKRLEAWGEAFAKCSRKQEQMKQLGQLRVEQRKLWLESEAEETKAILEEIDERYNEELRRIQKEVDKILKERTEIDVWLGEQPQEEREFAKLKFEKGYGMDYIAYRLHISTATAFRMQDRLFAKLAKVENL